MITSSSTTNPTENKTMFGRTQFFDFSGPDLCKIGENHTFLANFLKHGGEIRTAPQSKNHTLLISSSTTTNPMENKTIFRRTQFFGFTGPDLCKIGENHTFLANFLKHGGEIRTAPQSKNHTLFDQ